MCDLIFKPSVDKRKRNCESEVQVSVCGLKMRHISIDVLLTHGRRFDSLVLSLSSFPGYYLNIKPAWIRVFTDRSFGFKTYFLETRILCSLLIKLQSMATTVEHARASSCVENSPTQLQKR